MSRVFWIGLNFLIGRVLGLDWENPPRFIAGKVGMKVGSTESSSYYPTSLSSPEEDDVVVEGQPSSHW